MDVSRRLRIILGVLGAILIAGVAVYFAFAAGGGTPAKAEPQKGVAVGFWVSGSASIADAHKQVDAHFGMTTQLPRNVPPGLALKAIWLQPSPPSDTLQAEVLDYYPKNFVPPTAAGQTIPRDEPHIQVTARNHEGTDGDPSTPLDLGLPGYTAVVNTLSPAARQAVGNGTGGVYFISGHGLSWTVEVWPSSSPSQADLMAFLRGIPPK